MISNPSRGSLLLVALLVGGGGGGGGTVTANLKIAEAEGGFEGVLGDLDRFGSALANLGDLDGDGVADLAVGMPGGDRGGQNTGALWILFMNPDGTVRDEVRINDGRSGFEGDLWYTDALGSAIANLGDLDGDGVVDLAVGVPGQDGPAFSCGLAVNCNNGGYWILFMNPDGTVKDRTEVTGRTIFGGALFDELGSSLAGLGDLDGDGVPDLAAGAPGRDFGTGILWIVLQNPDGSIKDQVRIGEGDGGFGSAIPEGSAFGASVATIGDLDGDSVVDLAVGARADGSGGPDEGGAVWILFLNDDGTVKDEQRIDASSGGFTGVLEAGDHFGSAVAPVGDLNGDGVVDLAVGAYTDDDGGTNRGAVWILFLDTDGTVLSQFKISDTAGGFDGTLNDAAWFGLAAAAWRENADGTIDVAVGTPQDDGAGEKRGAVWLLTLEAQACATASAEVRNGAGVNPEILSWMTLAHVGQPLELRLDCSAFGGGAASVFGRGAPTAGRLTRAGERLIDVSNRGPVPFHLVGQGGGVATLVAAIPNDPALCGLSLFVQGMCSGSGGPQLSNAVDFVIGD